MCRSATRWRRSTVKRWRRGRSRSLISWAGERHGPHRTPLHGWLRHTCVPRCLRACRLAGPASLVPPNRCTRIACQDACQGWRRLMAHRWPSPAHGTCEVAPLCAAALLCADLAPPARAAAATATVCPRSRPRTRPRRPSCCRWAAVCRAVCPPLYATAWPLRRCLAGPQRIRCTEGGSWGGGGAPLQRGTRALPPAVAAVPRNPR